MELIYYFDECPTCKNYDRNLVRQCALEVGEGGKYSISVDERYLKALPDVWGEEADYLADFGAKVPFLYNMDDRKFLNVDYQQEDMGKMIQNFMRPGFADEHCKEQENIS